MTAKESKAVESFFEDRPGALRLFRTVSRFIQMLGSVEMIARKTQLGFRHGRMFAWIWLPQMWIRFQPQQSITLAFMLDRRRVHKRIKESVEPYPGRFMHHVVIERASDFDGLVKGWLRDAHSQAGEPGRRRPRKPTR